MDTSGTVNKVVMEKVIRRKGFILGKSSTLESVEVAEMANGDIRYIQRRKEGHFLPGSPLLVSSRMPDSFEASLKWVAQMESAFITDEIPEWRSNRY